ncbi:MAG: hypothetical protein HDS57_03830 [Barnesiella sp.]|nr:hypothetical protein [Barnesiella sp.]
MKEEKDSQQATPQEAMEYPGVALNTADNDAVSEKLEKQSTKELNNNPRNTDMDDM